MMPLPSPWLVAALCTLLWLAGPASAGSLRVQVLDAAGKPLEGAVVALASDAARKAVRPLLSRKSRRRTSSLCLRCAWSP